MSFQMTNAPYNAMQQGYGSRSGIQNLSTATNDPRMRAQTLQPPTVHNEVISSAHSTPVKQNAPTGGLHNAPGNRTQGSGSGGNFRTPDAPNTVSAVPFFYFKLVLVSKILMLKSFYVNSDGE